MDLINKFLNLVAPPFTFFSLCLLLPPYQLLKFFLSVLSSIFSENVVGKVVLITGASSGIGEQLAYEYASRGARLSICARREKRLREVADRALELGSPDVIMTRADVSKVDDCRLVVDETIRNFGRLDHLVNNAGISHVCMFEEMDKITDFRTVMDVNFWGSVYITRFAVPYLRDSQGKIVVLSSSASWLTSPRMTIYNASKAALFNLFETLRIELAPDIKITIVAPGFVESELTQGKVIVKEGKVEIDQELSEAQVGIMPVASARDCAEAIVNSACRGERYLTVPRWFNITYYWKAFCPEVIDWCFRLFYLSGQDDSPTEAPSKNIIDITGAKNILYPTTIQSHEIKAE